MPAPQEEQPKMNSLDSNQFFSGMNVSKGNDNPNEYNPPDLFAGLNLSMGGDGSQNPSQNVGFGMNMGQNQSMNLGSQQNTDNVMMDTQNTQMNMNQPSNIYVNTQLPNQQPSQQQNQQMTNSPAAPSGNDSGLFFGMQMSGPSPLPQASSPQSQFQAHNISNEFSNTQKNTQISSNEGAKLDQTKSSDNSFHKEAMAPKVESANDYNPPDLFANLNVSASNPPKQEQPQPIQQNQKPEGFWSAKKKNEVS